MFFVQYSLGLHVSSKILHCIDFVLMLSELYNVCSHILHTSLLHFHFWETLQGGCTPTSNFHTMGRIWHFVSLLGCVISHGYMSCCGNICLCRTVAAWWLLCLTVSHLTITSISKDISIFSISLFILWMCMPFSSAHV